LAVRLVFEPLVGEGEVIVRSGAAEACRLWATTLDWTCRDAPLSVRILAAEALDLPRAEPTESVPGALARLAASVRGTGAILILLNPAQALGPERIAYAEAVRCLAIETDGDEACWDALLTAGLPVYGVRGTVWCDVKKASPHAALSAMAYGMYTCGEGLELARFTEHSHGVNYHVAPGSGAQAAVIVSGGFRAAAIVGDDGEWTDAGNERYVRLVISARQGRCWTQPRFIAPRPAHGG
jgi:hypothetical protein